MTGQSHLLSGINKPDICHVTLRKSIQFGKINIKSFLKVGQTAYTLKACTDYQIRLQQNSLWCTRSSDYTAKADIL